jgi:predicted nucleic acid-binding protein
MSVYLLSASYPLRALAQEGIGISLITFGEIYEGIYYGRDQHKAEIVFRQFLRMAETLPLTQTIMPRFAQIIGDFDMLIAATALYHALIVVTRNMKDSQRIPQLRLYK